VPEKQVLGFCVMGSVSFAGCSVLIVEDEPLVALDLRQAFEFAGAHVFAATQFAQALTLAGHPDLSLAVLDYRIGDDTSDAVCRELDRRGVPFLFYSGYDDMLHEWPEAVVVNKPTKTTILIEKAAALLSLARSHAAHSSDADRVAEHAHATS